TGYGFLLNLRDQLALRKQQGFKLLELDNPDSYTRADVKIAMDEAAAQGFWILAKNPGLDDDKGAPLAWTVDHPAVVGVISERDSGSVDALQRIRGKRDIPVFFVAFDEARRGAGYSYALMVSRQIEARGFPNMSVSYSDHPDEYGNSHQIINGILRG